MHLNKHLGHTFKISAFVSCNAKVALGLFCMGRLSVTAFERARFTLTGFVPYSLGFFYQRFSLVQTSTYFSSFMKASGFFSSASFATVFCGLPVYLRGRFHKSEVLLTTGCGTVWQPSSLALSTPWGSFSFTFPPTVFPTCYFNYLA